MQGISFDRFAASEAQQERHRHIIERTATMKRKRSVLSVFGLTARFRQHVFHGMSRRLAKTLTNLEEALP
jgi:hypothetical protein